MENKKAIVVGGGVSGLSAAWELKNKGFEVTVIERRDAAGGVIHTFESGGFRAESGTNSVMVTSPRLLKFFEDAGLGEKVERSKPAAKKRFLSAEVSRARCRWGHCRSCLRACSRFSGN